MKILLVRFSSIGDIVLTTPLIRCLKKQTEAELHFLTKKSFAPILLPNPHLDSVFSIERKIWEVVPILRRERYDYIIDLHHNMRSFSLKKMLFSVPAYSFKKLNIEKWLLVNFKINRLPNKHIVDRYIDTAASFGIENDGLGLDFFFETTPLLPLPFSDYIALPIGAGKVTKALTVNKIVEIIENISIPIVLLGGKKEVHKAKLIERKLEKNHARRKLRWSNLVGKCSLAESAWIIKNATIVLTGDTGLMHIAAAFKKNIITIWGNTTPKFGMYPYYAGGNNLNTNIEHLTLPCRPCSKIGYDACPQGHFNCIEQLDSQLILSEIQRLLT